MSAEKMLINAKTLRANQTEAEQRLWYHHEHIVSWI